MGFGLAFCDWGMVRAAKDQEIWAVAGDGGFK